MNLSNLQIMRKTRLSDRAATKFRHHSLPGQISERIEQSLYEPETPPVKTKQLNRVAFTVR